LVLPAAVNQDEKGVTANRPGILTPSAPDKNHFNPLRSRGKPHLNHGWTRMNTDWWGEATDEPDRLTRITRIAANSIPGRAALLRRLVAVCKGLRSQTESPVGGKI